MKLKTKSSVVIVYTGNGKGKTTAALGLTCRALGAGKKVAFISFIKSWHVSEDTSLEKSMENFPNQLTIFKGGLGFYHGKNLSDKSITDAKHKAAADKTLALAKKYASSGEYDLVVCDEINNAVKNNLITRPTLEDLIKSKHSKTSLCLTGRGFPKSFLKYADIATKMTKLKHHYDAGFAANEGIDF